MRGGTWQVFYHHGLSYANEVWEPRQIAAARASVEMMGTPKFLPVTASNSWAMFYWRLRFDGQMPTERLRLVNAPMARSA